jgi:hypothetical protein
LQGGLALSGVSGKLDKQTTFSKKIPHSMGSGGFLFPNEAYTTKKGEKGTILIEISSFTKRVCLNEEDALAHKVTEPASCPA